MGLRDSSPAADQVEQEDDRGDYQQDVDQPAGDIECESEYPEQQEQDDKRP